MAGVLEPQKLPDQLNEMRAQGIIPLCVLAYNIATGKIEAHRFSDQNHDEINAMLAKVNLKIMP